jgi:predicted ATPase
MTEPQVADFIEAWSGQHASPLLATTMQGRTGGNPLFLEEVLRHLADTGALYQHDRLAEFVPADELTLPPAIRAVVELQLDSLTGGCERFLTNAAVLGSDFEVETVRRMMDGDVTSDALAEALAAGIVEQAATGFRIR